MMCCCCAGLDDVELLKTASQKGKKPPRLKHGDRKAERCRRLATLCQQTDREFCPVAGGSGDGRPNVHGHIPGLARRRSREHPPRHLGHVEGAVAGRAFRRQHLDQGAVLDPQLDEVEHLAAIAAHGSRALGPPQGEAGVDAGLPDGVDDLRANLDLAPGTNSALG